jgi:hypothetical protein
MRVRRVAPLALVAIAVGAPLADASRAPTKRERADIRRVVEQTCGAGNDCRDFRSRISSVDARFASASASGESFSPGGVVKRPGRTGGGWRWAIQQSGGPERCSVYRKRVPVRVLREFRIRGVDGRC